MLTGALRNENADYQSLIKSSKWCGVLRAVTHSLVLMFNCDWQSSLAARVTCNIHSTITRALFFKTLIVYPYTPIMRYPARLLLVTKVRRSSMWVSSQDT